jgi:PIN domain
VTASRRCPRLINAGHRWFGVRAVTPRPMPSGQFCRVSFTNPFTSRACRSHPPADTSRWDATTVIEGLHRPLWSTEILAELEYHETQKLINRGDRPDAAAARAGRQTSEMTTAFDDTLVESWEPRDGTFNLPDPDDEHAVGTALVGGAGATVTDNLKDFPIGMNAGASSRSTGQEGQFTSLPGTAVRRRNHELGQHFTARWAGAR